jgi:Uma2 family endonuclease
LALRLLGLRGTMTAMTARMTDAPVPLEDYVPKADRFVVLRGDWGTYQTLLAARGERSSPRIAYLDGVLQLMTVSREHEGINSVIADLVKTYCLERGIPYSGYGSWTQKDESAKAGLEPDECFIFDEDPKRKATPDLAIEVIWTSGGISKLEIYRRLGIGEVWFWKKNQIAVYVLRSNQYVAVEGSACLPDLDLALVARLAVIEPMSAAVLQFREILRQTGGT